MQLTNYVKLRKRNLVYQLDFGVSKDCCLRKIHGGVGSLLSQSPLQRASASIRMDSNSGTGFFSDVHARPSAKSFKRGSTPDFGITTA